MSKKQKVNLEDIKVGEEVSIIIKAKVLSVDSDRSIHFKGADGNSTWIWPESYGDVTFKVAKRPLVPDDATALSFIDWAGDLIFAVKNIDGSWIDTDENDHASTEALIEQIKRGDKGTLWLYEKRGN